MADTTNKKKLEDYGSFDYADYKESDSVTQRRDRLDSWQKPGDFASQYTEAAKQAMDKYMNRDKFTYDVNGDALYQQYKDQYITQGKLAMQDTIGQASAMTGGFGNSYAENVGQQAYHGYLQQLNDKVPELYKLAYDQYNQEGENLLQQYGLLADRENTEYGRYRDTVSDAYAERDYLTNQLNAEREFDYSKYSDDRNFDYSKFSDDRNLGYQLDRDAVSDSQWQADYDRLVSEFEKEYQLSVRKIEEDERNGKISREVALREIQLAEDKFEADKIQAQNELAYKYAALKAKGEDEDEDEGVEYEDTENVTSFVAKIRTPSEFARGTNADKTKYGDYKSYVKGMLEKYADDLTDGEIAAIVHRYNLG